MPRDHWLEDWEKRAITEYAQQHPLEGYRRLAFMMLDADVVAVRACLKIQRVPAARDFGRGQGGADRASPKRAVRAAPTPATAKRPAAGALSIFRHALSPSSVYRVLKAAGLRQGLWSKPTRKGTGFVQPLQPHEHWHIDFSYVNIGGTFYYLCSVLDGASRFIVHWEIREAMKAADAEMVLQRAREKHPQARPRIISDNGPQFVAKEFKELIRLWQTSHVFTSPHYPQSNGQIECWHRTLKEQAIRPKTPLSLAQARQVVGEFVDHYNHVRLHSAIGFVTPQDKLAGRAEQIWRARDAKLEAARERRRAKRAAQKKLAPVENPACH